MSIGGWNNTKNYFLTAPICEFNNGDTTPNNTRNLGCYNGPSSPGGIIAEQINCASGEGYQGDGTWLGDGVDAKIEVDYHPEFSATSVLSLELYAYFDFGAWMFGIFDDGSNYFRVNAVDNGNGTFTISGRILYGGVTGALSGATITDPGTGWHHIVLCKDGGNWSLWVNNTKYALGTHTMSASKVFTAGISPLQFATAFYEGPIKWFAGYDACLTDDEVANNYANREKFYGLRMSAAGVLSLPPSSRRKFTQLNVGCGIGL